MGITRIRRSRAASAPSITVSTRRARVGSFSPKNASNWSAKSRKMTPMAPAIINPKRAATCTARMLRSGRPAPRFCPAIADAAPISPTDVHVMKAKSSV
jgi:hypothetical protein